jgi:hypothetical protein
VASNIQKYNLFANLKRNSEKGFSLIEPFHPSIIGGKIALIGIETALDNLNYLKIKKIGSLILKNVLIPKYIVNAINIAILKMPFSNLVETYSMPVAYAVAFSLMCKGISFMTPVSFGKNETVFTEFEKVINLEIDNQAMKVDQSSVEKVELSNPNEILIKELIKKKGKIPLTREEVEGFSVIISVSKKLQMELLLLKNLMPYARK